MKNELFVTRNGSPLLVGFSAEGLYVSSEAIGFSKYTNEYFRLKDKEIIGLNHKTSLLESIKQRLVFYENILIKDKPKGHFRCFFEEEIFE